MLNERLLLLLFIISCDDIFDFFQDFFIHE